MKYFLDTEFIEGFHKPLFGKRRHFIDLISIGIVAEDGRIYYAISNEFRAKDADQWVRDNVISMLPTRSPSSSWPSPREIEDFRKWKSNRQIMQELRQFFGYTYEWTDYGAAFVPSDKNIEIYAYYADYDWVLFCSLFGRMIDLPEGMPMYCRDLKQMLDAYVEGTWEAVKLSTWGHNGLSLDEVKKLSGYPRQENEHNALDDAKWSRDLFAFLSATATPAPKSPTQDDSAEGPTFS